MIAHACRLCGGRLLRSADNAQEVVRYRCANCGIYKDVGAAEKVRAAHRLLCFCGARVPGGVKLSLRCTPNPLPSLQAPDQIIATALGLSESLQADD